ncbi:hypothetical protein [Shewanella algae]|uniref:hypothetical protein n=1 Tax=Shewanella algae TaxID=38313 RepID=UPI0031F4D9D6
MLDDMNKRDMLKHKLDRISKLDLIFESVAETAEKQLQERLRKHREIQDFWGDIYDEIELSACRNEEELDKVGKEYSYAEWDIEAVNYELLSLLEMRIVHLYKSYELLLKSILKTLDFDISQVRNINDIRVKYRDYGTDLASIEGYQASDELRLVNNSIKHSTLISDQVKVALPEFSNASVFDYCALSQFFDRTKPLLTNHVSQLIDSLKLVLDNNNDAELNEIVTPIQALSAFAESRRSI